MKQRPFFSTTLRFAALTLLASTVMYSTASLAAGIKGKNRTFPYGCRVMGYNFQDDLLIIKPVYNPPATTQTPGQPQPDKPPTTASNQPQQTMYLIHNKSNQALSLTTKKEDGEAYKPDNENVVNANQWAAFAMDSEQVKFICMHGQTAVNCGTVLEVCQYNHAKFSDSTLGTYWVVKSDTLENAVYGAIHIGILLRW